MKTDDFSEVIGFRINSYPSRCDKFFHYGSKILYSSEFCANLHSKLKVTLAGNGWRTCFPFVMKKNTERILYAIISCFVQFYLQLPKEVNILCIAQLFDISDFI